MKIRWNAYIIFLTLFGRREWRRKRKEEILSLLSHIFLYQIVDFVNIEMWKSTPFLSLLHIFFLSNERIVFLSTFIPPFFLFLFASYQTQRFVKQSFLLSMTCVWWFSISLLRVFIALRFHYIYWFGGLWWSFRIWYLCIFYYILLSLIKILLPLKKNVLIQKLTEKKKHS